MDVLNTENFEWRQRIWLSPRQKQLQGAYEVLSYHIDKDPGFWWTKNFVVLKECV